MKTFFKAFYSILIISAIAILVNSCVKDEYDEPEPYVYRVDFEANTTIAELKALYDGDTTLVGDSIIVKGTVISSDELGNFYKELVIQDSTGGLSISIDRSPICNDYPLGTTVYIKCGGLYLGEYGGVTQLGSLYEDGGVWKFGRMQGWEYIKQHLYRDDRGEPIQPKIIKIGDENSTLLNTLVQYEDVQFTDQNLGYTYADIVNNIDQNRPLEDCDKESTIILRTSGYARFAGDTIASGKGSLIAVLSQYNGTYQLKVRSLDDIDLTGERCYEPVYTTILEKNFNDQSISSGGWTQQQLIGTAMWGTDNSGGAETYYAKISSFSEPNKNSDAWLISPSIDLSNTNTPTLNFWNAWGYPPYLPLEVKISTNYDGSSLPDPNNWDNLSFATGTDWWDWISSGDIDLSDYKSNNVHIAFVYKADAANDATWEIEDIEVFDISK